MLLLLFLPLNSCGRHRLTEENSNSNHSDSLPPPPAVTPRKPPTAPALNQATSAATANNSGTRSGGAKATAVMRSANNLSNNGALSPLLPGNIGDSAAACLSMPDLTGKLASGAAMPPPRPLNISTASYVTTPPLLRNPGAGASARAASRIRRNDKAKSTALVLNVPGLDFAMVRGGGVGQPHRNKRSSVMIVPSPSVSHQYTGYDYHSQSLAAANSNLLTVPDRQSPSSVAGEDILLSSSSDDDDSSVGDDAADEDDDELNELLIYNPASSQPASLSSSPVKAFGPRPQRLLAPTSSALLNMTTSMLLNTPTAAPEAAVKPSTSLPPLGSLLVQRPPSAAVAMRHSQHSARSVLRRSLRRAKSSLIGHQHQHQHQQQHQHYGGAHSVTSTPVHSLKSPAKGRKRISGSWTASLIGVWLHVTSSSLLSLLLMTSRLAVFDAHTTVFGCFLSLFGCFPFKSLCVSVHKHTRSMLRVVVVVHVCFVCFLLFQVRVGKPFAGVVSTVLKKLGFLVMSCF